MKRHLQCAEQQKAASNFSKYCACHAKGMSWLILLSYETSVTMRGATGITLQPHQIVRLPRKRNVMIDPHQIWNVIYNARSNRHHPPTSRNTAPATQNESHDWSASHMKRHLQCAEQQASPSNLTKYCACHAKWISWLIRITYETSFTMRGATDITLQPHEILRLPTQNQSHDWSASHMKRPLQCAEQKASPSNLTKYCACHAKWISWLIRTHRKRPLRCAEQQASPSNLTKYCACHAKWAHNIWQKFAENRWNVISNARPIRDRSENIRAWSETVPTQTTQNWTRRAAKATFRTRQEQILLKITAFPAPAIIPNFTTCCACHEKWHMNFAKYCACQEKWHMNFTKCCTCHEKWHMNFTKCCTCHEKWHKNFTKYCTCHKKWHMNFSKCCTCHKKWHMNFTKCCTCREKSTWTSANAAPATKKDTWTSPNASTTTTTPTTTTPVRLPKSSYIGSLPLNFLWLCFAMILSKEV